MIRRLIILVLIVAYPALLNGGNSVTNAISKALNDNRYNAISTTIDYAKNNHNTKYLNCVQYAYKVKDINPNAELWITTGRHVIAEVKEGNKTYCYSNGKLVKSSAYTKVQLLR